MAARATTWTTEAEEAVAAATAETILQIRGVTTLKGEIFEISLSGDYEATTELETMRVRVLYQTTDGTFTGATEVPGEPDDPTPAWTTFHSSAGEPSAGNVLIDEQVPANGTFYKYWDDGQSPLTIDNATSNRIGIEVTSTVACNVSAYARVRPTAA